MKYKFLAVLALLIPTIGHAQMTRDSVAKMAKDSTVWDVVVYNAQNKTMMVYRWKDNAAPVSIPLLNDCTVVVMATSPLRLDTFNPIDDTPANRDKCLALMKKYFEMLNYVPTLKSAGKIGVSDNLP